MSLELLQKHMFNFSLTETLKKHLFLDSELFQSVQ